MIFIFCEDLSLLKDCNREGSRGHQTMLGLCEILGLLILKLVCGVITSTVKASLNHTSCEQLQGTILLAATSQLETCCFSYLLLSYFSWCQRSAKRYVPTIRLLKVIIQETRMRNDAVFQARFLSGRTFQKLLPVRKSQNKIKNPSKWD